MSDDLDVRWEAVGPIIYNAGLERRPVVAGFNSEHDARLAACAPEALQMLLELGLEDDVAWLALMVKAGLR